MTVIEITEKALAYQARMGGNVSFPQAVCAVTRDEKVSDPAAQAAELVKNTAQGLQEQSEKIKDTAIAYQREMGRKGIRVSDIEAVDWATRDPEAA